MKRSPVQSQSVDWFLYDRNLRHERVNIRHYAHDTIQLKYVRDNRASIYLFKVNNKITRMTPGVVLVSLSLTSNIFLTLV